MCQAAPIVLMCLLFLALWRLAIVELANDRLREVIEDLKEDETLP